MAPLDPALKPFLDKVHDQFGGNPEQLGAQEWRRIMEQMSAATRAPRPPNVRVEDHQVTSHGRALKLRVYQPAEAPRGALIYMHGGGWVLGSVDTHDGITAAICAGARLVVISVNYALAPEQPYPAALQDAETATAWALAQARMFGFDPATLMIGGDSAGGNMAAALCLKYRDEAGRVPFCHQLLVYPVTTFSFDQPSYTEHRDAPFLNHAEMVFFRDAYLPNIADRSAPYAAPLLAADLRGLPPATVLVAEHDPLRDEGAAYAARLIAAGVNTQYRIAADLPHGFLRMRAWSTSADREFNAMLAALRAAAGG